MSTGQDWVSHGMTLVLTVHQAVSDEYGHEWRYDLSRQFDEGDDPGDGIGFDNEGNRVLAGGATTDFEVFARCIGEEVDKAVRENRHRDEARLFDSAPTVALRVQLQKRDDGWGWVITNDDASPRAFGSEPTLSDAIARAHDALDELIKREVGEGEE